MATATKKKTTPSPSVTKPITNPELKQFQTLVEQVINEVLKVESYRKSVKDDSPVSIQHYTNQAIKKLIRSSKWA